jgi:hypothetical protein
MASAEQDDDWAWCYVDRLRVDGQLTEDVPA